MTTETTAHNTQKRIKLVILGAETEMGAYIVLSVKTHQIPIEIIFPFL